MENVSPSTRNSNAPHIVMHSNYSSSHTPLYLRENDYTISGVPEASASFTQIPIRPGISLTLLSFMPGDGMKMHFEMENAPIQFVCCLGGESRFRLKGGKESSHRISPGVHTTYFTPDCSGVCEIKPHEKQVTVGLQIDPELFQELLASDPRYKCVSGPLASPRRDCPFVLESGISPQMHAVAEEILRCPYKGVVKNLFLESKAMELLYLQFNRLMQCKQPCERPCLKRCDMEKLEEARRVLIESLKTPPTLDGLSRKVGLNTFKLKQGFKELYGATVFEYYRCHKIKEAKKLIEEKQMSVKETAWEMGYSNVSKFIQTFKRETGLTPGQVARLSQMAQEHMGTAHSPVKS